MVNICWVKPSPEEIRSVVTHDFVHDAKPVALDIDDTG
jgi:hypothetical protein